MTATTAFLPGVPEAGIPIAYRALSRVQGIGGVMCGLMRGSFLGWIDGVVQAVVCGGSPQELINMFDFLAIFHQQAFQCRLVVRYDRSIGVGQGAWIAHEINAYGRAIEWAMEVVGDIGRSYVAGSLGRSWMGKELLYQTK
jgi:hypothetical protein